ncbi:MAG: 2-oxoacid:acceptor oxidoreductase family protein [Halobacteriales archaeon]
MSATSLDMTQVRWHSRGGQGGMTASQLLAETAFEAGRQATAFSFYGAERRGAAVASFNRISEEPIKLYSRVTHPDVVVVLDETLVDVESVTDGLEDDGTLIINSADPDVDFGGTVMAVDATDIAVAHDLTADGTPLVNTAMLGAVAAAGLVDVDDVDDVVASEFDETNATAVREAYERTEEV